MTRDAFLAQYPEFAQTAAQPAGSALLDAMLADASTSFSTAVCGTFTDRMVGLKCADLLVNAPNGLFARQNNPDKKSTYLRELERLQDICPLGLRVF